MSRIVKGAGDGTNPDPQPASRIIKHDVAEAREEAVRIRQDAESAAAELRESARVDGERLREEARRQGYDDGATAFTERLLAIQDLRRRMLEENRDQLLRLSVKVAQKILGREIATDSAVVGDLVIKALRGMPHQGRLRIRVRPADLEAIRSQRERLFEEIGRRDEIELTEDASIQDGGCVVESDLGIIDARLETQLRVLEKALLESRRRE